MKREPGVSLEAEGSDGPVMAFDFEATSGFQRVLWE
jgi:hypothetical protein